MSIINLMQRIREVSKALQQAKNAQDWETVEDLEDELFTLEDELENLESEDGGSDWIE